jgi:type I restriction enzyme S subunit
MLFSEFAEINPKVDLKKGESYPFIEMENLIPGRRYISAINEKEFTGGGSRFQTKDIIFARITPCLEHGKIAQIKGKDNEKYFGSTEFFVFRAKEGISDESFLFYLSYSDILRKPAEKSMYGASGRQRASLDVVKTVKIPEISFNNQKKISSVLSAYDDLIENNTRRIQICEEMAQRIFQEWFVNFRFSGNEKVKFVDSELGRIPEGWEVHTMGHVLDVIESGSRPKGGIDPNERGIPSIGAENILGLGKYEFDKEKYVTTEFYKNIKKGKIKSGDIFLYKDGAKIGRKSLFRDGFPHDVCCINEHVFILRTNSGCSQNYLYFYLDRPDVTKMIISLNANAAQPGINQTGVKSLPILLPKRELIDLFDEQVKSLLALLFNLAKRNQLLRKKRDLLLPKLISSKIDVENMDIILVGDTNENT